MLAYVVCYSSYTLNGGKDSLNTDTSLYFDEEEARKAHFENVRLVAEARGGEQEEIDRWVNENAGKEFIEERIDGEIYQCWIDEFDYLCRVKVERY